MQARALTIRLVRLAMAASLLIPLLLFAFASWTSYRNVKALADERIIRSLDVQQEQARKAFEIVDLTLDSANDLVSGMSDSDIRNDEERLHLQFKKLADAVAIVQSIWIYGKDGRAWSRRALIPRRNRAIPTGIFTARMSTPTSGPTMARSITRNSTVSRSSRSAGGCPATACS